MPINLDSCIAGVFVPGNIGASSGLPPVVRVVPSLDGEAPAIAEAAAAADTLDFFMGELLHEVASAADSYAAMGGAYDVSVAEPTVADDAPSVHEPGDILTGVTETAAATDTMTAETVLPFATFDDLGPQITLSNGNLTATRNAIVTFDSTGACTTATKSTGKYYFEFIRGVSVGNSDSVGIALVPATYSNLRNGQGGLVLFTNFGPGNIYSSGSPNGSVPGAYAVGDVIGCAVDLGSHLGWFRINGGIWNNSGTANPATGVGGVGIAAGTWTPYVCFANGSAINDTATANFGQSAFATAAPSGFTAGWPL